jgi:hypothetical protein
LDKEIFSMHFDFLLDLLPAMTAQRSSFGPTYLLFETPDCARLSGGDSTLAY